MHVVAFYAFIGIQLKFLRWNRRGKVLLWWIPLNDPALGVP